MKLKIGALLLSSCILITACKKNGIEPAAQSAPAAQTKGAVSSISTQAAGTDTVGNNVKGFLRLQLTKDSINSDNILIAFDPASKTSYVGGEDAPTFQGFGVVSLSSISSDGIPLAINSTPLTNKGLKIGLKVYARNDGIYSLDMKTVKNIPAMYDIWLIDNYRNDSLQYRTYSKYNFNVITADTASFGSHRFKLVIRPK
ncbi:MAG TPA: hypothetical protein VFE54_14215 [Mucilaginibacter sp.]|jgi:hypothetical protein|nr:hypothetical protein [Mucilaginibacter sp.]